MNQYRGNILTEGQRSRVRVGRRIKKRGREITSIIKIMKYLRLLLLLPLLSLWTKSSNAQMRFDYPTMSNYYYLYSSEDRVYYNHNNKWEPVLYEETPLENKTIIKTNAPFTLVRNASFYFCPEARDSKKISDLVGESGKNIKTRVIPLTSSRGVAVKAPQREKKFHNLQLLINRGQNIVSFLSSEIYKSLKDTTTCITGYNRILTEKDELTKDSILASFKTLSDSISDRKYLHIIILYIICHGNKDKEGKYHFMVSDSEYDSLTCKYKNSIPADTISTCIKELRSKGADVYIYIDTNHPDDLARNISHLVNSYYFLWNPYLYNNYIKDLFREMRERTLYDFIKYDHYNEFTFYNIYYDKYLK